MAPVAPEPSDIIFFYSTFPLSWQQSTLTPTCFEIKVIYSLEPRYLSAIDNEELSSWIRCSLSALLYVCCHSSPMWEHKGWRLHGALRSSFVHRQALSCTYLNCDKWKNQLVALESQEISLNKDEAVRFEVKQQAWSRENVLKYKVTWQIPLSCLIQSTVCLIFAEKKICTLNYVMKRFLHFLYHVDCLTRSMDFGSTRVISSELKLKIVTSYRLMNNVMWTNLSHDLLLQSPFFLIWLLSPMSVCSFCCSVSKTSNEREQVLLKLTETTSITD